jgi:hypothetical protein
MDEGKRLDLILTDSSMLRFKQEIFPYLEMHFHQNRVVEIIEELFEKVNSLRIMPTRGAIDRALVYEGREVRFLIFKSGNQFEIKILYLIDQLKTTGSVIDFFSNKNEPIEEEVSALVNNHFRVHFWQFKFPFEFAKRPVIVNTFSM